MYTEAGLLTKEQVSPPGHSRDGDSQLFTVQGEICLSQWGWGPGPFLEQRYLSPASARGSVTAPDRGGHAKPCTFSNSRTKMPSPTGEMKENGKNIYRVENTRNLRCRQHFVGHIQRQLFCRIHFGDIVSVSQL